MESLKTCVALVYLVVIVAGVAGWFMNIFALIHAAGGAMDGMFILRVVGVFVAPLGSILGLFF